MNKTFSSVFDRTTLLIASLMLLLAAPLAGCGGDEEAEQPIPDTFPTLPSVDYTEGHLAAEQRGLPLDRYDLQVIQGIPELGPDALNAAFGVLVLNVPYQDWPALCTPTQDATRAAP